MNKMDAVRAALAELGSAAKPSMIVEWCAKKGVQIGGGVASSYKSKILGVGGESRAVPATASEGSSLVEDLKTVKALVERLGAAQVHELVDLFGT